MNELVVNPPPGLSWEDWVAWHAARLAEQPGAKQAEDFEVTHMFKGVWYIREFQLDAGLTFIGRPHLQGHIVKLVMGRARLFTPQGSQLCCAPTMLQTKPGDITVCYTIDKIRAQSWHLNPDGCRDIAELEAEYFGPPVAMLQRGQQLMNEQKELTWSGQ